LFPVGVAAAQCAPVGFPLTGETPANWWPGDDTSLDIVTGVEATLQNGASFDAGVVGMAFDLDGQDQSVTMPDSRDWNFGTCDFSIMAWANARDLVAGIPLVSHDEGAGDQSKWIFWAPPWGGLTFHINSPATSGIDLVTFYDFQPELDRWYHFAVTRKHDLFVLYVNGLPVASATDSHKIPVAKAPLMIGQAEAFPLNGLIDEVKIYRRALSAAEVRSFGFIQGASAVPVP
ncbi:MAG: LamG domain-containing protein, partial [Acidobacteriota bacterium]